MAGSDKTEQRAPDASVPNVSASSDAATVSFHYDALDTLIGRSTSGGKEQRFYRNDELVNEIKGDKSSTFIRVDELALAEQQAGGIPQTLLLAGDDKNSVLSEISRDAVKGAVYSAYGHRAEDGAVNSHLGYNGERRETQTGWYLLGKGYRVFNPLLMRFHSPDNLSPFGEGGVNAYMYCVGDPINNVDPTGHLFLGRLTRLFAHTTESAKYRLGTTQIPKSFLRTNPNKAKSGKASAASVKVLRPKDLEILKKRKDFYVSVADDRKAEYVTQKLLDGPGVAIAKAEYERSVEVASSAKSDHTFAESNLHRRVITRHSLKDFKKIAKGKKEGVDMASEQNQELFFTELKLGEDEMKNIRRNQS